MIVRRGFTLLEMLLATALAAMLVVGVMGVVTNITRANYASSSGEDGGRPKQGHLEEDPAASIARWSVMLADEVAHAVAMEPGDGEGFALVTYGALTDADRGRAYRPVVVRYAIREVGGARWLVRLQGLLNSGDRRAMQSDLVVGGVRRVALEAADPLPPSGDPRYEARLVEIGRSPDSPVYFAGLTLGEVETGAQGEVAAKAGHVRGADLAGWRLRVWLSDDERPTFDRSLEVR